jgi:hypothetical protein
MSGHDTIVFLRTTGSLPATKKWRKDGSIQDFGDAKNFVQSIERVTSISELHATLQRHAADPQTLMIRGAFIGDVRAAELIGGLPEDDRPAPGCMFRRKIFFKDQPLHTVMLDIDGAQTKINPLIDPEGAICEWMKKALRPEFHDVSFSWHLSSSAGHPEKIGLRAHVFFWLSEPRTSAAMKTWAAQVNAPVDKALFDPIQAHYTALPVFDPGVADPVKKRFGLYQGLKSDSVEISIPEIPAEEPQGVITDCPAPSLNIEPHPVTLADVQGMTKHLDPNAEYEQWTGVLWSIYRTGLGTQDGSDLADWCALGDEWSRGSAKYQGQSFDSIQTKMLEADARPGYGWRHLIEIARAAGFKPTDEQLERWGMVAATEDFPASILPDAITQTVKLISGTDIQPVPISWLWPGYLARGKLEIEAGAPGTSKTTIALALAAITTTGGKWPDDTQAPTGNVLIWSGEDSPDDTLIPRFAAMGGDRSRIFFVSTVDIGNGERRQFDPSKDMAALQDAAQKIGNVSLIIVDPIVSAIAGDSHKNSETRRGLQPLVDLAENLHATVLGISHYTKGTQGGNPIERVTGSIAFGAVARIIFGVAKTQDSEDRIFVRAKSNIGPDGGGFRYQVKQAPVPGHPEIADGAATIEWGESLQGSAQSLLKEAETIEEPNKTERALNLIPEWLTEAGGEMPAAQLKERLSEAGIGRDAGNRAIKELNLTRKKPNGPRGELVYEMPKPIEFGDIDPATNGLNFIAATGAKVPDNFDLVGDIGGAA